MSKNQGNDQSRNAGNAKDQQSQQSAQQGSQQHGGQHASGGTPALDDPSGKQKGESAKDAAKAFDQQNADSKKR